MNHAPKADTFVVGSSASIGSWNPDNAIQLKGSKDGIISAKVEIKDMLEARDLQYKFIICHLEGDVKNKVEWEEVNNRHVNLENHFQQANEVKKQGLETLVTLEDKGFNQRSDNYPRIRSEQIAVQKAAPVEVVQKKPTAQPIQDVSEVSEFDIVGGSKKPQQVKSQVVPPTDLRVTQEKRDSTYSNDMKALKKMPQNMGPEMAVDADTKGPFDLADPHRKSVAPYSDFSQEMSQIVAGQKISPIIHSGQQNTTANQISGFGGVVASGNTDSTAKFDEEESLIAVQEMIQNINQQVPPPSKAVK